MLLRRLLPPAAVLVAAAALPSPAAAAVEHVYTAKMTVTTQYDNVQSERTATSSRSAQTTLSTTFTTDVSPLIFRNGRLWLPMGNMPVTERTTGSAESIYRDDWRHHDSNCDAVPEPNPSGRSYVEADLISPLDGSERLVMRVTDSLSVDWDCSESGSFASYPQGGFSIDAPMGEGGMDVTFDLPQEAIGKGQIIQLIDGPPAAAGDFCPDLDESSTHCSFSWTGQLELRKIETRTVPDWTAPTDDGDDLIAPLVPQPAPPKPTPAPRPHTPPTDDGDDLIAPLVPASKASVKGAKVSFRAGCTSGCAGTAVLTAGGGAGARAAAKRRPLATLRFRVPAGAPRTVTLKLPAKARKALRRAKRGTLAVTLRPKAGAAVRTTLPLRVR
jgi:hypothetical protein